MPSSAPRQTGQLRCRSAARIPTICIVDPQAGDYQNWVAVAQETGVNLEVLASAEAALRLSRTTTVDLWVVNVELPGLSGCELCRMLKAQSAGAVVYLVADAYSPESEQTAWQARATLYGCKPAQRNWLDAWLEQQRSRRLAGCAQVGPPTRCATGIPSNHERLRADDPNFGLVSPAK